jgi:hypothetical protein
MLTTHTKLAELMQLSQPPRFGLIARPTGKIFAA